MKLKFRNQQFQTDAVNAVADLFIGQEKNSDRKSLSAAADGWTGDFGGIRRKNLRDLGSAIKQSDEIV